MARRNSQQSVSLFPFLAVLVCTMGALILLLLVTTRRIRQEQARYSAAVEVLDDLTNGDLSDSDAVNVTDFVVNASEAPSADDSVPEFQSQWLPESDVSAEEHERLQAEIELAKTKRAELQEQKQDLESQLTDQHAELASITDQIHEAEVELLTTGRETRQLAEAESDLKALNTEKADLEIQISQQQQLLAGVQAELEEKSAFTEEAEAVLTKRESALVSLRRLVAESSKNIARGSSATHLEFTNTQGTARVPIVINIDDKGFTFEPTGITVTLNDLKGFPANDNPLLAGIQAAAEHRSEGILPDDPYVLLLVRPSGSLGFYQAQAAMTNANIHFGYELLEADRTVAMGQASSDETQVVRQSILEALSRRANLYGALLAAQQRGPRGLSAEQSQQRLLADAGGSVAGRSASNDRRGADGRTLQELMELGRVYAGGEPKPEPTVRRFGNSNSQPRQWGDAGNRMAETQMARQQPEDTIKQSQSMGQGPRPAGDSPQMPVSPTPGSPMPRSATELAETSNLGTGGPATGEGMGFEESPLDSTASRSLNLSENMGLNSQLTADEMPNPTLAEATDGGQVAMNNSRRNEVSPDVDWPSVEAAPQPEGTRPVDPELVSGFMGVEAGSQPSGRMPSAREPNPSAADVANTETPFDSPTISPRQSRNQTSENFVGNQNTNPVQPNPLPGNQPPAVADTKATRLFDGQAGTSSFGTPGGGEARSGYQPPVNPQLSYLQQFLDEVEQQRSKDVPNPVLLRLLRRAQNSPQGQMSENLASPGLSTPPPRNSGPPTRQSVSQTMPQTSPPKITQKPQQHSQTPAESTPPQKKPAPQPVYYVVRVYVSDSQLIVGPFEPVNIKGWTDQQVAEAAFMGVSETMKDVWAEIRKDALPAVRFLSAEGSQQRCQITSQQLNDQKIPTRAMQIESRDLNLDRFFSDDLPPTTQQSTGLAPSASPQIRSQKQPATSNGRRMSI